MAARMSNLSFTFSLKIMARPFRLPLQNQDLLLATEVASRQAIKQSEFEPTVSVLSVEFGKLTPEKPVSLTARVCRERYTCQLFLRYKREIFILGVVRFLKTTRSFPKIPEEVRSLPKTSKVFRSLRTSINASSLPVLFTSKIRDCEEGIVIYSFFTGFSFLTWVWVNVFLEIVSSMIATTHIFQSGVRNSPVGVSRREIKVFNQQAWDSRLRRESWQV